MRRRFKINRICSSENYVLSKRTYQKYSCESSEDTTVIVRQTVVVTPKYYVKCFGKLVEITKDEASRMQSMTIICK